MNYGTHALVRPCPLCRSSLGTNLGSLCFKVFDNSPITGSVALVACGLCGFVFYDTPDAQADFDQYYRQNAYYSTAVTTGSGGSSHHDTLRYEALFQRFAPHIPFPEAVIIDVGCAKGGLLSIIAQHGFSQLYGVDLLPESVAQVKTTGFLAETGSALALPFPEVQADVLIYSHVVEHVINLAAMVAAAHKKLSDAGIIYVEVPDASRYGECSRHPYQDLYLEHVNHFDISTLTNLFESNGFQIVSSGTFLLAAHPSGDVSCAFALFRKGPSRQNMHNRTLERHLRGYMDWSGQHASHNRFATLALAQTPLFLWGISQYAMLMLGQTALRNCNIRGFVDKDPYKRTRTLLGQPIESPEVLCHVGTDHAVVVMAPGHELSIAKSLAEMNFRGMLISASGVKVQL